MAYDDGDITERERLAAQRQKEISQYNADSLRNQLSRQLANYDFANAQNRQLADTEIKQAKRKNMEDRFEARRNLQNAALGLFGAMSPAMNGSSTGNILSMLENRDDADNSTYWSQYEQNRDTINNAYEESANQNQVLKRDAVANAAKALNDIEADLSANLSNINPNLYEPPGTGEPNNGGTNFGSWELYQGTQAPQNYAQLSGYIMPENSAQNVRPRRNMMRGNDYFGRLMNNFNYRR